jgi:hypothetical protein
MDETVGKRLVYNTRPEGCQETGEAGAALVGYRKFHILNQFRRRDRLTLAESGFYTGLMKARQRSWILIVAAAVLAGSAPVRAQTVHRSLYVSAVDADGHPVPDLGPRDFAVREDGVGREVLSVAPADQPMQIAVLVDDSTAARGDIADIRRGLEAFVTALTGSRNEISIVGTADRPTILADYSSSREQVMKGVHRIFERPDSGMVLLDALMEVSNGLLKRDARRPVIVSVTTEGTEFSNRLHGEVIERMRLAGAQYFAVTLGPPTAGLSTELRERALVFTDGTAQTGGRQMTVLASSGLTSQLSTLADQLNHEYLVTYAHPESLIPPERVTVTATRPGVSARGVLVQPAGQEAR